MKSFFLSSHPLTNLVSTLVLLGGLTCVIPQSDAIVITDFTGDFDPSNWTTTLSGTSDASATFLDDNDLDQPPYSNLYLDWESGNEGSYIDQLITISRIQGTITFSWSFYSTDPIAGNQSAGYVLNGVYHSLVSNDGTENVLPFPDPVAPVTVDVSDNDVFGFRFQAENNTSAPAYFNVNNFSADVEAVPWETDVLPLIGATVMFGGAMWWKRKRSEKSLEEFNADQDSINS